jgi:hypothetical protein
MLHVSELTAEYVFSWDNIKEFEMDGACVTYGGEEKFIVCCDGETWREEITRKT